MGNPVLWAIVGVLLTVVTLLGGVIFKMGHTSARVEALEAWKMTMREDMHEISEILTGVRGELKRLATLIEERTDRRASERE